MLPKPVPRLQPKILPSTVPVPLDQYHSLWNGPVSYTHLDVYKRQVKQIAQEVGVLDILVNNAGIIKRIPMCEMTAAQFRQVVDVDPVSYTHLMHAAVCLWRRRPCLGRKSRCMRQSIPQRLRTWSC